MTENPASQDPARAEPFEDHFGGHAAAYAAGRPRYPEELFDRLAALAPGRTLAWDAATGNGQAAVALAGRFERVVASDASLDQLRHAAVHPRVQYIHAPAHVPPSPSPGGGCDLVTIAQGLHWFAGPAFDAAVGAALRPGGIVAAWSYGRCRIDPAVDAVVDRLHDEIVGPWWPERRRHVLEAYRDLSLAGEPVAFDAPPMRIRWSLPQLTGYLETWSATRRCRAAGGIDGRDPVQVVREDLESAWGEPDRVRTVEWPLASLVRRRS